MRRLLIIIAIISLTGCAEKSRFDCPYGNGPSCLSMSEIDKNIKASTASNVKNATYSKTSCGKKASNATSNKVALPVQADAKPAVRIPETVLQMWISPYEANSGIYYQASFVNIIVKDAQWQAPVLDDLSTRENYNG